MKIAKPLLIGTIALGIIHEVATFTPLISDKISTLDSGPQHFVIYLSLMCGALLILGGANALMMTDKLKEHAFLRKPYALNIVILALDGIMAACAMPHNPFAWMVLVVTAPLLLTLKK